MNSHTVLESLTRDFSQNPPACSIGATPRSKRPSDTTKALQAHSRLIASLIQDGKIETFCPGKYTSSSSASTFDSNCVYYPVHFPDQIWHNPEVMDAIIELGLLLRCRCPAQVLSIAQRIYSLLIAYLLDAERLARGTCTAKFICARTRRLLVLFGGLKFLSVYGSQHQPGDAHRIPRRGVSVDPTLTLFSRCEPSALASPSLRFFEVGEEELSLNCAVRLSMKTF